MTSIPDLLAHRNTSLFVTRSDHLIPRMNRSSAGGPMVGTEHAIDRAYTSQSGRAGKPTAT